MGCPVGGRAQPFQGVGGRTQPFQVVGGRTQPFQVVGGRAQPFQVVLRGGTRVVQDKLELLHMMVAVLW